MSLVGSVRRARLPCLGCGRRQQQGARMVGVAGMYCAGCYDLICAYMPAFQGRVELVDCTAAYRPTIDAETGRRYKPTFADLADGWYRSQGEEVPRGLEDPVPAVGAGSAVRAGHVGDR